MSKLDRVTRSLLDEFIDKFQIGKLDGSTQFELFASYIVLRKSYHEDFDPVDCHIGEGGDGGIDFIGIVVNGTLISDLDQLEELVRSTSQIDVAFTFVQATTSSKFDGAKISSFGYGVEDFFAEKPKQIDSKRALEFFEMMNFIYENSAKFRGNNPICRLFYVCTGNWQNDEKIIDRQTSIRETLEELNLFRKVEIDLVGASQAQKLYNDSKNSISRKFQFKQRTTIPDIAGIDQAYLGFIPATVFLDVITDDDGGIVKSIFHDNVRDWLGNNPVNKKIQETIDGPNKDAFVVMNNGITLIARKLNITSDDITIEDFQIVNGCQTSHSLYEQRDSIDETINVPLRVIATDNEDIISSIVQATNRQTQVSDSQFFSLEEFAKRLEAYFPTFDGDRRVFFERRANQYSAQQVEKTRVVNQRNLINSFASMFLEEAHSTTRNHKALEQRIGEEIFSDEHELFPYYSSAFAYFRMEYLFRTGRLDTKYKSARFHLLMAAKILAVGSGDPPLNSKKLESHLKPLVDALWSVDEAENLFDLAAGVIESVAKGDFHRDNIRAKPFTDKVKSRAEAQFKAAKSK